MMHKIYPKDSSISLTREYLEKMIFASEEIVASNARVAEIGKEIQARKAVRCAYPAIFTYKTGQEISVVFPDLDVATSGISNNDALLSARELLACTLQGLEADGKLFPLPTSLGEIFVEQNEQAVLIESNISVEPNKGTLATFEARQPQETA